MCISLSRIRQKRKRWSEKKKTEEKRRKWKKEEEDLKFYRAAVGRSINWATICRDVGGWNLTYPSNAGYPCARARARHWLATSACEYGRVYTSACWRVRATRIRTTRRAQIPRTRMDDVAYSPICLVASGEKTKWLSGAGFSPYAHALSPRRPNRVPNVEQRRHTNPYGYLDRRAGEWFFPSLFAVSSPCPPYFLYACFFPPYITWIKRRWGGDHRFLGSAFIYRLSRLGARLSGMHYAYIWTCVKSIEQCRYNRVIISRYRSAFIKKNHIIVPFYN